MSGSSVEPWGRHPFFEWPPSCISPHVLGVTLLAGSSMAGEQRRGGVTVVHPTLGVRLDVGGGGLEAWEPLKPAASRCLPRPPAHAPRAGLWNPTLYYARLALPGRSGWVTLKAGPLDSFVESGVASIGAGEGVSCGSGCARLGNRVYFTGEAALGTGCAQHDVYVLHPAGFTLLGPDSSAEAAIVLADCPRGRVYAASPWGVSARFEEGLLRAAVADGLVGVLGRGGFLEAVQALMSLVASPRPPGRVGVAVRCSGRPCTAREAGGGVAVGVWNPVAEPAVVEVVTRFRPGRVVARDPLGSVEVPMERGLARVTVPGYSWLELFIERRGGLAEALRRRLAPREGEG